MLFRVDARCVRGLLVASVTLAVCAAPVTSQIHWNRGWGAGGSMGKRSSSPPSSPSAAISSLERYLVLSSECSSTNLSHLTSLLAKILESEISRLTACELQDRLVASSSSSSSEEQEHTSQLPWWVQSRRSTAPEQ